MYVASVFFIASIMLIGSWLLLAQLFKDSQVIVGAVLVVEASVLALIAAKRATDYAIEPLKFLWQAIVHVSTETAATPAPNLDNSKVGRELVTALCLQVYELASGQNRGAVKNTTGNLTPRMVLNDLPLPVLALDSSQNVLLANDAAHRYIGLDNGELINKNFYDLFSLSFPSNDTFDSWLENVKQHTITSSRSWERVRLDRTGGLPLQFDMAAFYNKESSTKIETIISLFDHTDKYTHEDDNVSYVALAVHELRTPLTLLRGYIEVFEEELAGKLEPELDDFMKKTRAQAEQLSAFVNNILNVARVEADQLSLTLHEENWNNIVRSAASNLGLRAKIQNKSIELHLANNLPTVAADRVSIYEVLSNLIDNGIKYSSANQKITIKTSVGTDEMIETTILDSGVGIAASVVPHLFEKFYRNHRTEQQVGGTGLGLYLSKAIVNAHGGNIWIRSKEGQGTTVGFTLKPYSQVAGELKSGDNKDIVRSAHGWIKNHSLNRR